MRNLHSASFALQTADASCVIFSQQDAGLEVYCVQLFHRQLVLGIPSFKLQMPEQVMAFSNGFLFREPAEVDYDEYCSIMESVYNGQSALLKLFGVKTKKEREADQEPSYISSNTNMRRLR